MFIPVSVSAVSLSVWLWYYVTFFYDERNLYPDVELIEFTGHAVGCLTYFLFGIFFPLNPTSLWHHRNLLPMVIGMFVVQLILNFAKKLVDPTSILVRTLHTIKKVYQLVILVTILHYYFEYPHIWPYLEYSGWIGDFRGYLLYIIPAYIFTFCAANRQLLQFAVIFTILSFVMHIVLLLFDGYYATVDFEIWLLILEVNAAAYFSVFLK